MSIAKIRSAEIQDFDDIFWLLQQLWPDKELDKNALRAIFVRGMSSNRDEYLCAVHDDKVIGFCALSIINSFWQDGYIGYLCEFVIESAFRDLGIDSELMENVINTAKNRGCKRVEINSVFYTKKAHNLYEKYGFKKTANIFSKVL